MYLNIKNHLNKGDKSLLFLTCLPVIIFLISDNFNYGKVAVFAQETAAGQFSTYTNEEYGVTMQYPSNWIKTEGEVEDEDAN